MAGAMAHNLALWLLAMLPPVFASWAQGDLIVIVNNDLANADKILEYNSKDPNYPDNLHPLFVADSPGDVVLGSWDYWYITNNSDASYKIHNAYNNYALDTLDSSVITPVVVEVNDYTSQGFEINDLGGGSFSIFNHYLNRSLGLDDDGYPAYVDPSTGRYTAWGFIAGVTTSTVTETSTQTITSTTGDFTSTVTESAVVHTSTVFVTATNVVTVTATPTAAPNAKRWVGSVSTETSTVTTTTVIYDDAVVTISGGTTDVVVTHDFTLTSTLTVTASDTAVDSASTTAPGGSSGSSLETETGRFLKIYLILGLGFWLAMHAV